MYDTPFIVSERKLKAVQAEETLQNEDLFLSFTNVVGNSKLKVCTLKGIDFEKHWRPSEDNATVNWSTWHRFLRLSIDVVTGDSSADAK